MFYLKVIVLMTSQICTSRLKANTTALIKFSSLSDCQASWLYSSGNETTIETGTLCRR